MAQISTRATMEKGKGSETSLRPGTVALRFEVETKGNAQLELTRWDKFRVVCSPESIIISLVVLGIGGGNFFIFYTFENGFNRVGLWPLFALGVGSCLVVFWFLACTCVAICSAKEKKKNQRDEEDKKEEKKESKLVATVKGIGLRYKQLFDVNGKYYLAKMYAAETFEHAQQLYSLFTIYLCVMPVHVSVSVCAILSAELLINIWATYRMTSPEIRDRLLLLDILTDLFCLAFPLLYCWLVLRIPVTINETLSVTVYPTVSLLSKLNDIWEDYFNIDLQRVANSDKSQRSRRTSVLKLSNNLDVFGVQLKNFPNWLRYGFTVINIMFVVLFVTLSCLHLSTAPSHATCTGLLTKEVWNGCKVPVPFCQDAFVAKCDCALLEIKNYSQAVLPESFGNLSSLVQAKINNGELKRLPKEIGNDHGRLVFLSVTGNRLEQMPDSVGNLNRLIWLHIFDNQLIALPETIGNLKGLVRLRVFNNQLKILPESIGQLENVLEISMHNNRLESLPESVGKLKQLMRLYVFNNQLKLLPKSIGQMRNLVDLLAWNNQMTYLPDSVGDLENMYTLGVFNNRLKVLPANLENLKHLSYLDIHNNELTSLPKSLGKLKNLASVFAWNNTINILPKSLCDLQALSYFDIRNNTLSSLPSPACEWGSLKYLYLAGNPLCAHFNAPNALNGVNGLCEKQCSIDCPDVWLANGLCDDNDRTYQFVGESYGQTDVSVNVKPTLHSGCNVKACRYDNGACSNT